MTSNSIQTWKKPPIRLNKLLNQLFKGRKWGQRLDLHEVFSFWNEVVGAEIAAQAQPAVIRGNVLWVNTVDPIWMQQLHFQKVILLEKINQRLKQGKLSDIRFRLETGLAAAKEPLPPQQTARKPEKEIDPEELQAFAKMTSSLKNEDIRHSLQKLWEKMHRCR